MRCAWFALIVFAPVLSHGYADPGGAFAIQEPSGWTVTRNDLGDGAVLTEIYDPKAPEGAHIDILHYRSPQELAASDHQQVNGAMLDLLMQFLGAEATISSQRRSAVTYSGRAATRIELEFKDEDGVNWKGYALAVCGRNFAIVIMPYAKASDTALLDLTDRHARSLAIESRNPDAVGRASSASAPRTSGFLSQATLTTVADRVDSNFTREPMDRVISPGQPPLTYGSVANFVTVMEILFDVQFTESEFEATRERFIEYYGSADAEGKRILAEQGAALLQTLTTGTEAERQQSKEEGRAVFEQAFSRGAEMGIGYAQVMWDAISRRRAEVRQVEQQPSKDDWDTTISEADIDALMEMLFFMWASAGRDTSDVTLDDVMHVRGQILEALPTLDPQIQLVIANAPKVYAALRQQWQAATPFERTQLAAQYGQALDEWGIGNSGFEQSSGGGGGEMSMNAQIAQNTAWNSAKTWSSSS